MWIEADIFFMRSLPCGKLSGKTEAQFASGEVAYLLNANRSAITEPHNVSSAN